MSKYRKLLYIIRDARERLQDEFITEDEANAILKDVWKEYNELSTSERDPALQELLFGIFDQDKRKDLNFLT